MDQSNSIMAGLVYDEVSCSAGYMYLRVFLFR
jgi:hypothetical protein